MDISLFMSDELTVWVPVEDARVKVRYMTTVDRSKTIQAMTTIGPDGLDIRRELMDVETCVTAVIDWEGFEWDGQPLPCTPDNVRKLAQWPVFARAVSDAGFDLERFRASALDDAKKN